MVDEVNPSRTPQEAPPEHPDQPDVERHPETPQP